MGWRFSKSIRIGPLRINFSRSGIGWSIGGAGIRTGVDGKGRSYKSVSLPGTGVSYRTQSNASTGANSPKRRTNLVIFIIAMIVGFLAWAFTR